MLEESEEWIPTLTHAIERDIDLLLVEEIRCDFDFVRWVLSRLSLKDLRFDIVQVLHSKRRTFERREIDIHVQVTDSKSKKHVILLIENKIDEKEQPGQGASYREEIKLLSQEDQCASAYAVVVCPEIYARAWPQFVSQFDVTISYESIEAFFRQRSKTLEGELKLRLVHRAEMMLQAVTKQRRGYKPIPVLEIEGFNQKYMNLLGELGPEIYPGRGLAKDTGKPSDSVSMIFAPGRSFEGFAVDIVPTRFAHELGRGKDHRANYVNVQFRGFDKGFDRLTEDEKRSIESDGIEVEVKLDRRSGKKTLKFMIPTPAVDNQAPFEKVEGQVREGIEAAVKLRQWCLRRVALLTRISDLSKSF